MSELSENASPRIVFMGSPDFAVASAEALHKGGVEIAGVVTVPDKPAGRGRKLHQSAVKIWAESADLPLLQPAELRDPEFIAALRELAPDLMVVVAFRILPPEVFSIARMGTINLHASLLPKYRGAAPINWAIIEGETETGVTTFLIDEKVDTGNILMMRKTPIGPDETYGELYARLKGIGAELLVSTVKKFATGELKPQPQTGSPTRAPKLKPETRDIDWEAPSVRIRNLVRGLCPVPAACTKLDGKLLKIFACDAVDGAQGAGPGTVLEADSRGSGRLVVAAIEGAVALQDVQLEGKKRMEAGEFLRGYTVQAGTQLG